MARGAVVAAPPAGTPPRRLRLRRPRCRCRSAAEGFEGWLAERGVRHALELGARGGDGERGVRCRGPVPAGGVVAEIPFAQIGLTAEFGESEARELHPAVAAAPSSVRLAAKLLRETRRGPASPLAPWLAALPDTVPNAFFLGAEAAAAAEYAPLERGRAERLGVAEAAWRQAGPAGLAGASRAEFLRAMALVHSRSFGMDSDSGPATAGTGKRERVMVPLADMFNHSGDMGTYTPAGARPDWTHSCEWEFVDGVMRIQARSALEAAEEATISYGDRSNDHLILDYGFVPLHNPHDDFLLFDGEPEDAQGPLAAPVSPPPSRPVD